MDMTGEYRIPASRAKVWEALNDPQILKQCITGCEVLEKVSDTEMNGKVTAKVGPVTARFGGKVTLSDLDPPNGYKISGEGTGGPAGFAKGAAVVALREDGSTTILTYKVDANVGGKLAQIGSRLIDGTARKMADEFFAKFAAIVGAAAPAAPAAMASGPTSTSPSAPVMAAPATPEPISAGRPPAQPAPQSQPPREGGSSASRPLLWGAVAAVVFLAAILFFIVR